MPDAELAVEVVARARPGVRHHYHDLWKVALVLHAGTPEEFARPETFESSPESGYFRKRKTVLHPRG